MNQNGQNQKLGLRTSLRDMLESNSQTINNHTQVRKQVISVGKNTVVGNPQIVIKPPLTTEELKQTKYVNSFGINNARTDLHFNYNVNPNHSNFVPPPPSRFLVSSGHQSSGPQPSQLPIQSNHMQTIQTIHQPLYQSIRKTYVPYHINNEIPIMDSETKYYRQTNQHVEQSNEEIDQNDAKMLEQYEKLYQKYLQELEKSQSYLRKIQSLEHQLRNQQEDRENYNHKPEVREIIQTKQVYITKPTKVDTKQLISILMKKIKPMMDQTFQRKKASCLSKLKNLLAQQQSIIKTTVMRSSQQLTVKYKNR